MPKLPTGQMPLVSRNLKADPLKWERAMQLADANGETISDVLRRAIDAYIRKNEKKSA
jgi:hypothetical protein